MIVAADDMASDVTRTPEAARRKLLFLRLELVVALQYPSAKSMRCVEGAHRCRKRVGVRRRGWLAHARSASRKQSHQDRAIQVCRESTTLTGLLAASSPASEDLPLSGPSVRRHHPHISRLLANTSHQIAQTRDGDGRGAAVPSRRAHVRPTGRGATRSAA
jgi:hypothetical protein